LNDENKMLMEKYGITCEPKMIYSYKQHRYENVEQAINFARIDAARDQEDSPHTTTKR